MQGNKHMKITDIKEDPTDKLMNIVRYELEDKEKIMLEALSKETGKSVDKLIEEGFLRSADNFKEDKCVIDKFSSRVCECGTRSCIVEHKDKE